MAHKKFALRILPIFTILFSVSVAAIEAVPDYFSSPGINPTRSYALDIDGTERIDAFSGMLNLSYSDLVIPVAGGGNISIKRTYTPRSKVGATYAAQRTMGMGWDISLGRVVQRRNFCSDALEPTSRRNPVLEHPDGTRDLFYRPKINLVLPPGGRSPEVIVM